MNSVPASGPVNYVAERQVAEWVLSVGGALLLVNAEGDIHRVSDGKLPDGNWALLQVTLTSCQTVRDEDLERFSGCSRLRDLILTLTPLTGSGLKHLVPIRSLTMLDLNSLGAVGSQPGEALQDDMLAPLAQMPQLTSLALSNNTSLTDEALLHLAGLTNLERLDLHGLPDITDRGLTHLKSIHSLKSAWLTPPMITNPGVAELINNNPDLGELVVDNFDELGIRTLVPLSNAMSLAKVGISGDQLTPEGLAVLQELPLLEWVNMGVPITDEAVARLNDLPNLNHIWLYF